MADWLVFSEKGERSPDGSSNASMIGLIRADGTELTYPEIEKAGLSSWAMGQQFEDGRVVVSGYRDTSTAAAVSGAANSETWLWDPKSRTLVQRLLEHHPFDGHEVGIDAILPGGQRLICGVNFEEFHERRLVAMDLDGSNAVALTEEREGFHCVPPTPHHHPTTHTHHPPPSAPCGADTARGCDQTARTSARAASSSHATSPAGSVSNPTSPPPPSV